jgi:hypothetical protein
VNPDVAAAVERLARTGTLGTDQAVHLGRVARGELLSLRPELRALLYIGVLAITSGAGVLVAENLDRIGPVAIAAGLWGAATLALLWALRQAPPFSWGASESGYFAFDYALLLGVLLTGSALAYTEVTFTPLGDVWGLHLLAMSAFAGAVAVRGDSRVVFSIALTSLAAWRGVSAASLEGAVWRGSAEAALVRANALACGVLFVALGAAMVRTRRKPHFEPTATYLGFVLVLGALLSGVFGDDRAAAYRVAGLVAGAGVAAAAYRAGRFPLFGLGVVAAYAALSAAVVAGIDDALLGFLWFSATGIAVLAGLLVAHHAIRARTGAPA